VFGNINLIIFFSLFIFLSGCSTTMQVTLPADSELYINGSSTPTTIEEDGSITTYPYFWNSAGTPPSGGISFQVKRGKQIITNGQFFSQFRPMSLLWPPLAILYWPMGFSDKVAYNLDNYTETTNNKKTIIVDYLKQTPEDEYDGL